jgi:hypothetical protein
LYKGFISEVSGSGLLQWSTYFGDHDVNIYGMDVVPSTGHLVICGTAMDDLPDVQYGPPVNAINYSYGGGADAFIAIFDQTRQLYLRSWFGGASLDAALSVRATFSSIYMAGNTASAGLDMIDPGGNAYFEPFQDFDDCFLMELNLNGVVQWSTYFGGSGRDQLGMNGLYIGPDRDIFLCGMGGAGFPIIEGPNWYDETAANWQNGFVARFRGADRVILWSTYLGSGIAPSEEPAHYCTAVVQGTDGTITVAGSTTGTELPYTPLTGWYDQPQLSETQVGSFLVRFNNDQELLHATWFGGDASTVKTTIQGLAPYGTGVFATGVVWKYPNDPLSYWPLDDGGGTPWFDAEYNNVNVTTYTSDAFLTYFCSELTTSVAHADAVVQAQVLLAQWNGAIQVLGLDNGIHPYTLYDATGRVAERGALTSYDGRSSYINVEHLVPGLYILSFANRLSLKFNRH